MRFLESLRVPTALLCVTLALFTLPCAARAAAEPWSTPVGLWAPIDKATGKPLGLISILRIMASTTDASSRPRPTITARPDAPNARAAVTISRSSVSF